MPSTDDIKAKLAAMRAELAELEDARQARDEDPAELLAVAERELADAKALDAAERAHGKLGVHVAAIKTPRGIVIVKRPNHLIFRQWSEEGKIDTNSCERLIWPCLVHPPRAVFDSIAEELPGVIAPITNLITRLAGAGAQQLSGK